MAAAAALWWQPFADAAMGWALRLGMTITIVGAAAGGLMTRPTPQQLEATAHGRPPVVGAHTVGASDGGPGLPGTNWSLSHGDLRVGHFVGLHAIQALALVGAAVRRRRWPVATQVRIVFVAAASHAALFALLIWQALRAQSIVAPDAVTLAALAAWAAVTVLGAVLPTRRASAPAGANAAVAS